MPTPTVLWPSDVTTRGYLYGWDDLIIVVAGVLDVDTRDRAEQLLVSAGSDKRLELSGALPPTILGRCTHSASDSMPLLDLDGVRKDLSVVSYRRPSKDAMRFYSLGPIELDINSESHPRQRKSGLDPLSADYDFTINTPKAAPYFGSTVVDKMNHALAWEGAINAVATQTSGAHPRRSFWGSNVAAHPIYLHSISLFFVCITFLLRMCSAPVPTSPLSTTLLKDISATIQQIDVRAEQTLFLPRQFVTLRSGLSRPLTTYAPQYINFYNCVWLILNDVIIGSAFGSFLCENHQVLGRMLKEYTGPVLVHAVRNALVWLDNWPAGLKLNTELSRFYCHTFVGLIGIWSSVLSHVAPYFPAIIYFIGLSGWAGLTMSMSLVSDLLSLLTVHLYVCYLLATAVFANQLRTAGSLWNLFRGKRYNVLRNRIDSWDYDVDQLLFGTILFTLVAFLFPTVLVYYLVFASARLAVILLHASIETLLAFMNHFPLFALMLRAKDPWRLPGGIYFVTTAPEGSDDPGLVIKNQPIPFSAIFFQYIYLLTRLSAHYSPLRLLRFFVSGRYLTPIPRYSIRYSMPSQQAASR